MPTFIETQFPIARLSAESYKERKAGARQTLTGLGKWWGRKPLILVRASILGMLMPASDNPKKDREIFLKILTRTTTVRGSAVRAKSRCPPGAMPLRRKFKTNTLVLVVSNKASPMRKKRGSASKYGNPSRRKSSKPLNLNGGGPFPTVPLSMP